MIFDMTTRFWFIAGMLVIVLAGAYFLAPSNSLGATTYTTIQDVQAAVESYKTTNGAYPTVQKGQSLLGSNLPANMLVSNYVQADGQMGYEVQYTDSTHIYSVAFGPQASIRTSTTTRVATTTP